MKKKYFAYVLLMFLSGLLQAQDFHFSQYNEAPLLHNPALTGASHANHRLNMYYRNQWEKATTPYKTYGFSYYHSFFRKHTSPGFFSAGLTFLNDESGTSKLTTNQALASIAYHLRIQKHSYFTGGIQGGITQKTINFSDLSWHNQYDANIGGFDPTRPSGETFPTDGFFYTNVAAGVLYSLSTQTRNNLIDRVYLNTGAAYYHFLKSDKSFTNVYNNPMYTKMVIHAKAILGLYKSRVSFAPTLLYEQQGPHQKIVFGMGLRNTIQNNFSLKELQSPIVLSIGYMVRAGDAFIPYFSIDMGGYFLGISYDATFNELSNINNQIGGFELNIGYMNFGKKGKRPGSKRSYFKTII